MFIDPLPTRDDFHKLYEQSNQFGGKLYRDPARESAALEYYTDCFRRMASLRGAVREPKMLEIGAGRVWLCRVMKSEAVPCLTVAQDVSD